MLFETEPFVGGIEQAAHSDRRVDSKAGDLTTGLAQLELKQVVGETRDDAGVVRRICRRSDARE